jgi:hypothetical protein
LTGPVETDWRVTCAVATNACSAKNASMMTGTEILILFSLLSRFDAAAPERRAARPSD